LSYAFQDLLPGNHCWGCGPEVEDGLKIRSFWDGDKATCTWTPRLEFAAGPKHIVYGGTIASVIDCHSIFTAIAETYKKEGREVGDGDIIWYVTASLKITYKKPTPIDQPLTMTANVTELGERKALIHCSLFSGGIETATGEMVAVRVSNDWYYADSKE